MGEARPFDPAPAAALLAEAWRTGAILTELPEAVRPHTLHDGYDVQDRLMDVLDLPVLGWKLGVGSAVQKRQTGVGRSIAGRVLAPRMYRPGDTIPLPNAAPATVEFEIAYVLGRDVRPDEPAFPIMQAVREVRTTFELVHSRFADRRAVGWPSFAADNAGFGALVLGDPIDPAQLDALRADLAVQLDGTDAAGSLHGEDATDPAAALSDLAAVARERGMLLPEGAVISTGTVSRPFDVTGAAGAVRARFLGREMAFRVRRGG